MFKLFKALGLVRYRLLPINGPIIEPTPQVMANIENAKLSCLFSTATSPMATLKTAIFPFNAPIIDRAIMAIVKLCENPNNKLDTPVPKTPNNNTGFLPNLVEACAYCTQNKNWKMAKDASK